MKFKPRFFFNLFIFLVVMAIVVLGVASALFAYVPSNEFYKAVQYSVTDLRHSSDSGITLVYPSLSSDVNRSQLIVSETADSFQMTYYWAYDDFDHSYQMTVSKEMYDYYKNRPHLRSDYQQYALSDYDQEVVRTLAGAFQDHGERHKYTDDQIALNIISFVYALPYTTDADTTGFDDYPRYPIETLIDGGDCEDQAILVASLLHELNQSTALIRLAEHVAVGLEDNGNYTGQFYEYNNTRYYYAGVSENGAVIGVIPPSVNPEFLQLHPVVKVPSIHADIHQSVASVNMIGGYNYKLQGLIKNDGPGKGKNLSLRIVTTLSDYDSNKQRPEDVIIPLGDLFEDNKIKFESMISVPAGNGFITIYAEGDNFKPVNIGGFYFNFAK